MFLVWAHKVVKQHHMMVSAEMKDKTKGHSDSSSYQGGSSDKKRGRRLRYKW